MHPQHFLRWERLKKSQPGWLREGREVESSVLLLLLGICREHLSLEGAQALIGKKMKMTCINRGC